MEPDPLSLVPYFITFTGAFALEITILIVLLMLSALISGAEVAFFGLSPTDVNEIAENKSVRGNIIIKLLERPKKLLATILIANNAINIGVVLLFSNITGLVQSIINLKSPLLFPFIFQNNE